jgi:hypothetical protein
LRCGRQNAYRINSELAAPTTGARIPFREIWGMSV